MNEAETPIRTHARKNPAGTMRPDRYLTACYFSRSQVDRLDRLAEANDVSRSLLVRRAVEKLLEEAGV